MVKGGPNAVLPVIAAFAAETPKISTGTVSGNTSTASSSPPRRSATESAAPISPMKVKRRCAGEQRQRDRAHGAHVNVEQQAEHRRDHHQRQTGGEPMRDRLHRHRKLERRGPRHQQVERAVFVVGGKQPVECEQACQQRAEPEDRRADAGEQFEIRPDGKRHHGDDDEKEQRAHQRAAADADGDAHVAHEARAESIARSCRTQFQFAGALEPDRPVRRGDDQAAAGKMRAHELGEASLRRCVERRGRLVQQPQRPRDGDQPGNRQPPPLPGRQIGCRQIGERVEVERRQRIQDRPAAAEKVDPEA